MALSTRLLSSIFTSIPALLFAACTLTLFRGEYFWATYGLMSIFFIGASLFFGLVLPSLFHDSRVSQPWMWILISGSIAWFVALLVLAILNNTPLCIAQDNGDGTNTFALCNMYTVVFALAYSPVEFFLLALSAITGGLSLKALIKSGKSHPAES